MIFVRFILKVRSEKYWLQRSISCLCHTSLQPMLCTAVLTCSLDLKLSPQNLDVRAQSDNTATFPLAVARKTGFVLLSSEVGPLNDQQQYLSPVLKNGTLSYPGIFKVGSEFTVLLRSFTSNERFIEPLQGEQFFSVFVFLWWGSVINIILKCNFIPFLCWQKIILHSFMGTCLKFFINFYLATIW